MGNGGFTVSRLQSRDNFQGRRKGAQTDDGSSNHGPPDGACTFVLDQSGIRDGDYEPQPQWIRLPTSEKSSGAQVSPGQRENKRKLGRKRQSNAVAKAKEQWSGRPPRLLSSRVDFFYVVTGIPTYLPT